MKKKLLLLGTLLAIAATLILSGFSKLLTIEYLKANREALEAINAAHPLGFPLLFVGSYIIQTALSLPGATLMTLAAGALFGAVTGTAYAVIGATTGAALAFLFARYLFRSAMVKRFSGRLEEVNRELDRSGLNYLLFLRLVPLFPFFLINIAAALTRIPLGTFCLGTFMGIIPGGFVYANAGASLATVEHLGDVASPRVIGAFVLLGIFALIPALYRRHRRQCRS
ncbi:TVP38/TMEM64 family protein [Geobacter sp. DSM 9736]|uniref:TVP38/TMEM64 family protein n=1 Tax=Geobacter sp. DSM 9736 TaxID=1277350 RepID=UPI000B50ED56|nr:TVP38/TMEM64 family protein [Geobacter sp. DSM 9736]SNB44726.1 Uncharacterized membrane protein YdjX, TVP38/TMEM64 family, SNARE-associated domain [Geobacter sp. DSM 9736]